MTMLDGSSPALPPVGTAVALRPPLSIPRDYVPAAESTHALYHLELDAFEGPLDLLLHLIRRHHLDIFDIPMAFICARYVAALDAMHELSLDVAAEFMFMASELMHIKSRMLLPQEAGPDEAEEGDPRADLVLRLLTYQTYRDAAVRMQALDQLGRDTFARPPEPIAAPPQADELAAGQALALTRAFSAVLARLKPEAGHKVVVEQVSMRLRMQHVIDLLAEDLAQPLAFMRAAADIEGRLDIIVLFLAMLELARLRLVHIYVSDEDNLYVQARFERTAQALERIAGLDDITYA
jgi:segregation and condensation protein A